MSNNSDETKFQREMKLLIHIILYLFLALAFIASVQVEGMKYDGLRPFVSANLIFLFLIGFIFVILIFMNYIFKNNYSSFLGWVLGLCGACFSFIFFKTFLDELKNATPSKWIINFINSQTMISSQPLSLCLVLILIIIFLLIIINTYRKKQIL